MAKHIVVTVPERVLGVEWVGDRLGVGILAAWIGSDRLVGMFYPRHLACNCSLASSRDKYDGCD